MRTPSARALHLFALFDHLLQHVALLSQRLNMPLLNVVRVFTVGLLVHAHIAVAHCLVTHMPGGGNGGGHLFA